jgi:hypothetical protein
MVVPNIPSVQAGRRRKRAATQQGVAGATEGRRLLSLEAGDAAAGRGET